MLVTDLLLYRLTRGRETMSYPDGPAPALPDRHGGALRVDSSKCVDGCRECVAVCPTEAITRADGGPVALDLGRCIFCAACVKTCPTGAITQTGDHRMAARERHDLVLGERGQEEVRLAAALDEKLRRLFGRSLRLRQVSAGGCNGCEADTNVLGTIGWDLGRFGIQFVASPRHADGLLITGPVTNNMKQALQKTWDAVPEPKIVIAVGACAVAGGPFVGHPEVNDGASSTVPVDLFIPGCPPHPVTILDGLLRLLDRLGEERVASGRSAGAASDTAGADRSGS
ncbi:MAG TPA: 4Fe-4S dicluster domain-containing protein [Gemmatimonadaceae bacterium]|jgi:Ni,Fe-hydrogenase III small subunit/formate hydrogenlyase subunit 6/NADH:ubiquinone oxidoreductase subunit I